MFLFVFQFFYLFLQVYDVAVQLFQPFLHQHAVQLALVHALQLYLGGGRHLGQRRLYNYVEPGVGLCADAERCDKKKRQGKQFLLHSVLFLYFMMINA